VPAIDTIHRKSLDILASGMSLMGFVSITDSPDRYHKDAIHRSCSSRERRRYPVARACQDQNFFVSLNADFILRSRRPKILRPTLFVEKNQSRNPRRAILVVASSEGTSRRSDDYAGLPASCRWGRMPVVRNQHRDVWSVRPVWTLTSRLRPYLRLQADSLHPDDWIPNLTLACARASRWRAYRIFISEWLITYNVWCVRVFAGARYYRVLCRKRIDGQAAWS